MPVFKTTTKSGGGSFSVGVDNEGNEGISQNAMQSTQYKNSSVQGQNRLLSRESARSSSENNASLDQIRESFCQNLSQYNNQEEA